jgi:predicted ribosome quality control (RQC) complex YloA/Tae2 family protein
LSGEREVSRDVALEYAKILNCDAVDLMFPKKTSVVWGKVNTKKHVETYKPFIPGEIYSYTTKDKDMETVIVPRDIWKKNIKAIKIEARGTMFDQQVAFYYFSNAKDTSCMNKLCIVGATVYPYPEDPDYTETNYYFGIYENNKGVSNLINADPFVDEDKKYILKNFEPTFISPVVCVVNPQIIIDETAKQSVIPETAYRYEEVLRAELNKAREELVRLKEVTKRAEQLQKNTERTQRDAAKIQKQTKKTQEQTKQTQDEAKRIYENVQRLQERLLQDEQDAYYEKLSDSFKERIPSIKMDDDKVA